MNVNKNNFVEPYYIQELGCLGLSASDIAKSLNAEPRAIREKLKARDFLERIKDQGFTAIAIAMANKTNGLPFNEFFLDVSAAKFFVAKYDSTEGDAYLAFLINLEKKVDNLKELSLKDPLLATMLHIQSIRVKQLEQDEQIRTLQLVSEQQTKLLSNLTASSNYVSALGFLKTKLKSVSNSQASALGKRASKLCRDAGVKIDVIHSEVYGQINAYPEDMLEAAWSEINNS